MFLGMTNQLVSLNMTSHDRHIGFQDGFHQQPPDGYFPVQPSSNQDTKEIQVANPMFSGTTNQLTPLKMTSHHCHIGFQDGRHQQPPNGYFPG